MKKVDKSENKKIKERKIVEKFKKKKDKNKTKYITKNILDKKLKNAITFTNSDYVLDDGIIKLRDNNFARVYSVDAIDLSLTSNTQKNNFYRK